MSALRYLVPPSPNLRTWCPLTRSTFSTTCGRLEGQKTGLFSRIKSIFSGASENIIDHQRRTLMGFESTAKTPENRIKYINIPPKNEDAGFRKEWGVSISDSSIEKEVTEEHTPNYVLKQKWGVNLYEPIKAKKRQSRRFLPQIPQREMKSSDLTSMLERQFMDSIERHKVEMRHESPPPIIDPGISIVPPIDDELEPLKPKEESESPMALGEAKEVKEVKADSGHLWIDERSPTEDVEDEIAAWQEVMARTKLRVEEMALAEKMKKFEAEKKMHEEKFSILPEAPAPKLDVAVIKPLDSKLQEYVNPSEAMLDVKNMPHRVDSKKFHTLSLFFLCLSMGGPGKFDDEGETQFLPVSIADGVEGSEEGLENQAGDAEVAEHLDAAESEEVHEDIEGIQKIAEGSGLKMTEEESVEPKMKDFDDYVRIPGDPYPFKREYFEKWQTPHGSPLTRENSSYSEHKHE
ncbi:uncharacterized protein LOC107041305 [Diachasma alloeum]|uniref:uncharacterized protein LOC107041305 n=1 Tax=Diachasma alloeum TaxID=454923 RepID=UPI00073826BA|nr:uncharacterized protein LOC107041305 [Diachasma alloeum]